MAKGGSYLDNSSIMQQDGRLEREVRETGDTPYDNYMLAEAFRSGFNARRQGVSRKHHPPVNVNGWTSQALRAWKAGWSDADQIALNEGEDALKETQQEEDMSVEQGKRSVIGVRVGDIVRYLHPDLDQDLPGIVTCVHDETCVNLWVPPDGSFPQWPQGPKTSVGRREGGPGSPFGHACWDFR